MNHKNVIKNKGIIQQLQQGGSLQLETVNKRDDEQISATDFTIVICS